MNEEELGMLLIASEDSMYRVARSLLHNDEDCADAIQDTIVSAFTSIHTLKTGKYAKTWVIRILINKCYDLLRKNQKSLAELSEGEEIPSSENPDYAQLYDVLYQLPEEMRLTITLYYMEGYSVKEIAEILHVSESAIKSRLSRGREKCRELFEKHGIRNYYEALV